METVFRDGLSCYKRKNSKIEDVLVADIDEGIELLGELTGAGEGGYLYLHVSPAAHGLLGEAPDKDSHLMQSAAKPKMLVTRSALKTDRHPKIQRW